MTQFQNLGSFPITGMDFKSSNECDFIQEFMDLDEFFDATTNVTPSEPVQPSFVASTALMTHETSNLNTSDFTYDEQLNNIPLGQVTNDKSSGAQEVPQLEESKGKLMAKFSNSLQKNGSIDESNAETAVDTRNMRNGPDRKPLRAAMGNTVNKDKKYWDRRMKNNIAAKRSRDAKRLKETSVVERWTFLEEENKRLREEISNMQERLKIITEKEKT